MSARPRDGGGFMLCNRLTNGNFALRAGFFVGDDCVEQLFSCRDCNEKQRDKEMVSQCNE